MYDLNDILINDSFISWMMKVLAIFIVKLNFYIAVHLQHDILMIFLLFKAAALSMGVIHDYHIT